MNIDTINQLVRLKLLYAGYYSLHRCQQSSPEPLLNKEESLITLFVPIGADCQAAQPGWSLGCLEMFARTLELVEKYS